MKALATALISLALLATATPLALFAASPAAAQTSPTSGPTAPIAFGMDSASMAAQTAAGVTPDYATFWIGPWTLTSGWGGPDGQLASMNSAGVTPAIHFYYWGDDISPAAVENGVWSSLHNTWKDRAGWQTLAQQLTDHLNAKMGGQPVVVFLESEFNKGGIETYEPFDGYMADMAAFIHAKYPAAQVVLGFGNWGSVYWGTFDRAAAESDLVGIQGMRGSTRQAKPDMYTLYDGLLAGVKSLEAKFPGQPIMLTDLAVSSYPEPDYVQVQADVLAEVFTNLETLKQHGVVAMIYRSWLDSPTMNTANYYGMAERYWGLANSAGAKPSAKIWVDGVTGEREASINHAPVASFTTAPQGLSVAVDGRASSDADADALTFSWSFGDGSTATGATASHAYAAAGTYTVTLTVSDGALSTAASAPVTATQPNRAPTAAFTATSNQLTAAFDASASADADGNALAYAWSFGDGSTGTGRTASHTYASAGTYTVQLTVSDGTLSGAASSAVTATAPPPPFTASFAVASGSNEWWEEVKVTSSAALAKVEMSVNGGAWQPMTLKSWGNYAANLHIVKGTPVVFRATDSAGRTASSPSQPWLGLAAPPPPPAFQATFSPKSVGNNWWVETAVSGNQAVAKVQASLNGGAWTDLPKDSWGTFAKSLNAPNGTKVVFKAISTSGASATSAPVTWY